jgi:plastocyanin
MRLLPATLVAFAAAAAPAHAADVKIQGFAFTPSTVTIALGDTVTWTYAGPDTNHSVTSDPGQADSWDSDPGRSPSSTDHPPGTTYARRFDVAGRFTYFCKVHPSMKGTVVVGGGGSPPPPPGDTTAPAISGLKASAGLACRHGARHCKPKPTVVRFSLSEDATVVLSVAGRKKATVQRDLKAGSNALRLSTRKLPPGKWKVALTATDASGNVSKRATATVTVRHK